MFSNSLSTLLSTTLVGVMLLASSNSISVEAASYNRTLAIDMAALAAQAYQNLGEVVSLGASKYTIRKKYAVGNDFVFTAENGELCVLAFRGSDDLFGKDWLGNTGNLDFGYVPFKAKDGSVMAYTHKGFTAAYDGFRAATNFISDLKSCLAKNANQKLVVAGHSRGGALATLSGIHVARDPSLDYEGATKKYDFSRLRQAKSPYLHVYTYGEPRSLLEKAPSSSTPVTVITDNIVKFRFVNKKDLVPSLPPRLPFLDYTHWGGSFRLTGSKVEAVEVDFPTKASDTGNIMHHSVSQYAVTYY